MHSLKQKFTSLKCTRNFIKYSGLKKHLPWKTGLVSHQCEVCKESFKCRLSKDFHKQLHHRPKTVKDNGIRLGK